MRESITRYAWVILALVFTTQLGNALAIQAIAPLAPLFQPELGLSKVQIGIFSSAVFAGSTSNLLLGGTFTDRFGIRWVMVIGQVATGLLLMLMGLVTSFPMAIVVMYLVGFGGGAVLPGVTKSITDWFPPRARATAMGIKQAAVPVGGIITASTLPAIALVFGWRFAIAMVGLVIVVCALVVLLLYREKKRPASRANSLGGMKATLAHVVRIRQLWIASFIGLMYVTTQLSMISYLALFFEENILPTLIEDKATRIVAAGGYLAIAQLGGAVGRVLWGVVSDRVFQGRRLPVLAGIGVVVALLSLATSRLDAGWPPAVMAVFIFLYGTTAIGWNGLYHVLMAESVGSAYAGTGVGISMTLSQMGTVLGPPLFGLVVDLTGSYSVAWAMLAGFSLLGVAVALAAAPHEKAIP